MVGARNQQDAITPYLQRLEKDIIARQEELVQLKNAVSSKEHELEALIEEQKMAELLVRLISNNTAPL